MTPEIRKIVDKLLAFTAKQNGVNDPTKTFNVVPRVEQAIETKVMQSNAFLSQINNIGVKEIKGDILGFGVPSTITKRTTTPNAHGSLRRPTDPTGLVQRSYECFEVEQDSTITWNKIDQWAHLPNFYALYRQMVMFAQARDRLLTMWWGQDNAANTDPAAFPLLQDVNKGFIQFMIDENPDNVLGLNSDGTVKPIKIDAEDPAADFRTLNQLAYYLRYEVLHRLFQNRTSLRIIIGDELTVTENVELLGNAEQQKPTERRAVEDLLQKQTFGETLRVKSDEFPRRGIVLSELGNLSRYWQVGSMRRKLMEDDHEKKGLVDYNYEREDYVVEAAEGCAVVHPDAIHLKDDEGNWVPADQVWAVN